MIKQVSIDNPVINSPFSEPERHFKFDNQRITEDIVEKRRHSQYFIPVPKPRSRHSDQMYLDLDGGTGDTLHENKFINNVRERVGIWRRRGYYSVTPVTQQLLDYWTAPEREKKFFFCQIEAIETLIYITEVADKDGANWIRNELQIANETANPKLFRIALKMATGTGKTVVMAMMIAWHTINKLANRQDRKFSDAFLIVTPGITIRDRLRVLLPHDTQNYYDKRGILPSDMRQELDHAKIVITNYHGFLLRATISTSEITPAVLQNDPGAFSETQNQMVRRVLRSMDNKKNIVVINDEAHHCYRRKPQAEDVSTLNGEEKKEAEDRNKEARVWISGIEAVKEKIGIKAVYDLSATPFFQKDAGYSRVIKGENSEERKVSEGVLFPWVVSDFSLIDAIESGLVKVPRVPVDDNAMAGQQPIYRDLWIRIRDKLPKKRRKSKGADNNYNEPKLPAELEGALINLYGHYDRCQKRWKLDVPPVMIIVCNNTAVSKLIYDWVAGYEIKLPNGEPHVKQGKLSIFSNEKDGKWLPRPNTILVDSIQLESGEALKGPFKKIAAKEIEQFKANYQLRFPGRNVDKITDADLLREVMNTVGKAGEIGGQIKCVISVSMLTEGWDAQTVTHILGVRAFGTQLLCEQVVGRGLRRTNYEDTEPLAIDPKSEGFPAEYAEVYGIPFSFIPTTGKLNPRPSPIYTHVQSLDERVDCEITFPKLTGYYHQFEKDKIKAEFSAKSHYSLPPEGVPLMTLLSSIVGESEQHELPYNQERIQQVEYKLAKTILETFRNEKDEWWLFPQLLEIVRRWLKECVSYKDNAYPQLLLFDELAHEAAHKIHQAIIKVEDKNAQTLLPILRKYDFLGSTRGVSFDTARNVYPTAENKCHISHVVADTLSWEQRTAQALKGMDEVDAYVKNHNLDFTIPYVGYHRRSKQYVPDFIVKVEAERDDYLNLIIEVSGKPTKDKSVKVDTARNLWANSVNHYKEFGRWAFLEISDPFDVQNTVRAFLSQSL